MHFVFPAELVQSEHLFFGSQKADERTSANQILNGSCGIKMQELKAILQVMHLDCSIEFRRNFNFIDDFSATQFTKCITQTPDLLHKLLFFVYSKFLLFFLMLRCTLRHNSMVLLFAVCYLWAKCIAVNFISIVARLSYLF